MADCTSDYPILGMQPGEEVCPWESCLSSWVLVEGRARTIMLTSCFEKRVYFPSVVHMHVACGPDKPAIKQSHLPRNETRAYEELFVTPHPHPTPPTWQFVEDDSLCPKLATFPTYIPHHALCRASAAETCTAVKHQTSSNCTSKKLEIFFETRTKSFAFLSPPSLLAQTVCGVVLARFCTPPLLCLGSLFRVTDSCQPAATSPEGTIQ